MSNAVIVRRTFPTSAYDESYVVSRDRDARGKVQCGPAAEALDFGTFRDAGEWVDELFTRDGDFAIEGRS